MRKKWFFASYDKDRVASLAERCEIPAFTSLLLSAGGIDTPEAVYDFFNTDALLSDPFLLSDMDKAAACILRAVDEGKRICVYGDYDADGVCATALLYSYLETIGADVVSYIPSRLSEGYGLHAQAVEKLYRDGVAVIVTVDTGINAFEAADRAAELGIMLVITDHHKPSAALPTAAAVVDPCRADDSSGLDNLAGVGVAFKLVCALDDNFTEDIVREYAQYVAVGTIADIMLLQGENRRIVANGLELLNDSPLPGLQSLIEIAGLADKKINATHVAFGLAPRINAAGRMGDARAALNLLLCESAETAEYYARELDALNVQRHAAEDRISEQITEIFTRHSELASDRILVVSGKNWHEGVIGIVASKVVDRYGKPAVIIAENADGTAKGSCRGIADFSIYDAVASCSDLLTDFGGHTLAAGFGLPGENIETFRKRINAYAASHVPGCGTIDIRCKLNPSGVSLAILDSLEQLEPYGAGNPKPIFAFCGMELSALQAIGNGRHTRMKLKRGEAVLQAVLFGFAPEELPYRIGDKIDIAAVIEKNEYNGSISPSVQIKAIRFAGTDDERLFTSYDIFRKIESGGNLSLREKQTAVPNRDLISLVYRYIKKSDGMPCNEEVIMKRIGMPDDAYCRIAVSVKALADCGLIRPQNGGWKIVENAPKTDLTGVPVLKMLGYIDQ